MAAAGREADEGRGRNPQNRERILLAGLTEFAAVGYEGASVSAIATRAGLNKQLIYHYFGSKRGLYGAVLSRMLEHSLPTEPMGTADLLRSTVAFEHAEKWRRLLGWEGLQYDGGPVPFARQRGESFDVLRRDVERLQREGRLDARIEPEFATLLVALALIAPQILPQLSTVITGADPNDGDFERRMVRTVLLMLGLDPD